MILFIVGLAAGFVLGVSALVVALVSLPAPPAPEALPIDARSRAERRRAWREAWRR